MQQESWERAMKFISQGRATEHGCEGRNQHRAKQCAEGRSSYNYVEVTRQAAELLLPDQTVHRQPQERCLQRIGNPAGESHNIEQCACQR
jgi:hypothetical protein